jgi:hypothetical protein
LFPYLWENAFSYIYRIQYRIIYIPFLLFSTKDVHYQMKLNLRNPELYFVRKCIFSQVRKQYSLSVLLVEETKVSGENHRYSVSHWKTLSLRVVSSTPHYIFLYFSQLCYTSITCSKIEHIPYNLIFTTKFNDSSILIMIISWDYLNLSLVNEYVCNSLYGNKQECKDLRNSRQKCM